MKYRGDTILFAMKDSLRLIIFIYMTVFMLNCANEMNGIACQGPPDPPPIEEVNEKLARMTYFGGPSGYKAYKHAVEKKHFNNWALNHLPTLVWYLDAFAKTRDSKYILVIKGHTDTTEKRRDNPLLASQRAKSFYDYLLKVRVPNDNLKYMGVAAKEPISGISTDARIQRRVTFQLVPITKVVKQNISSSTNL